MRVFYVRDPDYDDDWKQLNMPDHADPSDAAEAFAESVHGNRDWFQSCDFEVRDTSGKITKWTVKVEMVPQFTAKAR